MKRILFTFVIIILIGVVTASGSAWAKNSPPPGNQKPKKTNVDKVKPFLSKLHLTLKTFSPNSDGYADSMKAIFKPSEPMRIRAVIFNGKGKEIRRILLKNKIPKSWRTLIWNGKDSRGRYVRSGSYFFKIWIVDLAGNKGRWNPYSFKITVNREFKPLKNIRIEPSVPFSTATSLSGYPKGLTVSFNVLVGGKIAFWVRSTSNWTKMQEFSSGKGAKAIYWDGKDPARKAFSSGTYACKVVLTNALGKYSLRTFFTIDSDPPIINTFSISPNPLDPRRGGASVSFSVSERATITVKIRNGNDEVRRWLPADMEGSGSYWWNGKVGGSYPTAGLYNLRIYATDKSGNRTTQDTYFKIVYPAPVNIVICVDSEPRPQAFNYPFQQPPGEGDYSSASSNVGLVMGNSFRSQYLDSNGIPLKFSWFVEADPRVDYLGGYDWVYQQLSRWSNEISRFGDELDWHVHMMTLDYSGSVPTFNQTTSFNSDYFEDSLNHLLLDCGIFPSAFRSGYTWENNDLSQWLEQWIPFDLSNRSPQFSVGSFDPVYNIYDWSSASQDWIPYHPSSSDYRNRGEMNRVIARCPALGDLDYTGQLNTAFAQAEGGMPSLLAGFVHSYEDISGEVEEFGQKLKIISETYPTVPFHFVTASQGIRRAIYLSDETAPTLRIEKLKLISDAYEISSSERLFQLEPYCAAKMNGSYKKLPLVPVSTNRWRVDQTGVEKLAVGGSDLSGNSATVTLSN